MIVCTNCGGEYPDDSTPYKCPICGGIYDDKPASSFSLSTEQVDLPGMWRFRNSFGLSDYAPVLTLGEGNTPLVFSELAGKKIGFKLEYLNPTGSFKDRFSAVLLSDLISRGVTRVIEDSSGNAGASLAAYAAASGVKARIFVPDLASGPKKEQMVMFGAELVEVVGRRSNASEAVRKAADEGDVYASHAYMPQGLRGYSTIAYEIFEQLGGAPGSVIMPAGHGGLLLGIGRGFDNLLINGDITKLPVLVGVQVEACAPLWSVFVHGPVGLNWVTEEETIAEGIRVRYPTRGDAVLQLVQDSNGFIDLVTEDQVGYGKDQLARRGFYVEPTSAVVWSILEKHINQLPEPITVILTGSGYKTR